MNPLCLRCWASIFMLFPLFIYAVDSQVMGFQCRDGGHWVCKRKGWQP